MTGTGPTVSGTVLEIAVTEVLTLDPAREDALAGQLRRLDLEVQPA